MTANTEPDLGGTTPDPTVHQEDTSLAWGIGAVADRCGVAANTLRSWDRRYGVGPSHRSEGGHRRYGDVDVQRVSVMARMTTRGVPAATAAKVVLALSPTDLISALAAAAPPSLRPAAVGDIDEIVAAATTLDAGGLRSLYRDVLARMPVAQAWSDVLVPTLQKIGMLWSAGALGIHVEHLASEVLISELRSHTHRAWRNADEESKVPQVVLASADRDQHFLPLLALEADLAEHGMPALLLGARVPADALVALLAQSGAPTVFVWASMARSEEDELFSLLTRITRPLRVVVGGPGWPTTLRHRYGAVEVFAVTTFDEAAHALRRRHPARDAPAALHSITTGHHK